MHIKIFVNTAASNAEREILKKFYAGVETWVQNNLLSDDVDNHPNAVSTFDRARKRSKVAVEFDYSDHYTHCDVAVIMGSWKPRDKGHHVVRTNVATNAKCFVCIETPLLNRKVFEPNSYFRLGVNGFLNRDAGWNADCQPGDRFQQLGLQWSGWADQSVLDSSSPIVLAMQLNGDASMRTNDINEWCVDTVQKIRQQTDRPIIVRFHPAVSDRAWTDYTDTFRKLAFMNVKNLTFSNGRDRSLAQDLEHAWCVVAYSSGISVDAVYAGVPVIACDQGNFAWEISSRFIDLINDPYRAPDETVQQWFYNLAYCQWNEEEMQSGQAWQHLLPALRTSLQKEE